MKDFSYKRSISKILQSFNTLRELHIMNIELPDSVKKSILDEIINQCNAIIEFCKEDD